MTSPYPVRIAKCCEHMRHPGMDWLLLTKSSNLFYLPGDGRLCAYTMVTHDGKIAIGVPVADSALFFIHHRSSIRMTNDPTPIHPELRDV